MSLLIPYSATIYKKNHQCRPVINSVDCHISKMFAFVNYQRQLLVTFLSKTFQLKPYLLPWTLNPYIYGVLNAMLIYQYS